MKYNKYLKEIGIEWYDLPGTYKEEYEKDDKLSEHPAGDCRNEEDEEGFCEYEFFSLDYTLNLLVFSKLSYFREHYAEFGIPSCFCNWLNNNKKNDNKLWLRVLDEIIEGFKLALVGDDSDAEVRYKIINARRLLAEYWNCLWF